MARLATYRLVTPTAVNSFKSYAGRTHVVCEVWTEEAIAACWYGQMLTTSDTDFSARSAVVGEAVVASWQCKDQAEAEQEAARIREYFATRTTHERFMKVEVREVQKGRIIDLRPSN